MVTDPRSGPAFGPGETVRIPLNLAPGVYEIECVVAEHDDLGMRTTLVVEFHRGQGMETTLTVEN